MNVVIIVKLMSLLRVIGIRVVVIAVVIVSPGIIFISVDCIIVIGDICVVP